ncbi:hypothetical protein [Nocardia pneumoniae]|uniref:hypothetical protein n=1 Tax=Nocardia pneumoniae TaxID=228601 RepID=UPI000594D02D|nr:hypothetical protein [Nocardia pneumoniae]
MAAPRASRRRLWIILLIVGLAFTTAAAGAFVALYSAKTGKLPWTRWTYAAEKAKDPCSLIDGSVLQQWTGDSRTTQDNSLVDTSCTESSAPSGSARSASISVDASVEPAQWKARIAYDLARGFWTLKTDITETTSHGDLPNLGQEAYFGREIIRHGGSTWVTYEVGVLDDNLAIEVTIRVEFRHNEGAAPETPADLDDIQRITEQQTRRAMDQLRR